MTARKKATDAEPPKVRVRRARPADVPGIYACQRAAYAEFNESALCDERQLAMQQSVFPEGQLVAVLGKEIVGYAASLILTLDEESPWFSYAEITGNGTFSSHDPAGDSLYGADIGVHPDHRGKGIAGLIYNARKRILTRFNLRRLVAGGRIPGYQAHANDMTAEEYVAKVVAGELKDIALGAHLKAGYVVKGVHTGYVRDEQSLDYATYIELPNPSYRAARRRIAAAPMSQPVRRVRICAAQYRMRRIGSWDEFEQQVEFFVSSAEGYDCHILLLPELFTAQLFATLPRHSTDEESIAWLADQTPRYKEFLRAEAKRSGLMIAAGSHPVRSPTGIRNVAHLFTPAGNVYTQEKLHITPSERDAYGIVPGHGLQVFDTAFGRIAIVICYDIEFPELTRMLAIAGVDIVLVPFSTDERKGYVRVRYCAQARAVENLIYVVLSGNVGNLPQVEHFLLNYAQAAVLTPSDFPFPTDGVAATAEPQAETVVITDLDLGALEQVREAGSVGMIRDRRTDLYSLDAKVPIEIVRVT